MKKLFYISSLILFVSCQIEDENTPLPTESFIKYFGALAEQEAIDLEAVWNADSSDIEQFVILGTQQLEGETKDYYVATVDTEGNLINSTSFGFSRPIRGIDLDNIAGPDTVPATDVASKIHVLPNGYLVTGTSTVNATGQQIELVDLQFITYAFLDRDLNRLADTVFSIFGELEIDVANGIDTQLDLIGNDMLPLSDGTLLAVGAKETDTDLDFYLRKFSKQANGQDTIYWERTYGLKGGGLDDVFVKAFENSDGSISVFGYSDDFGSNGEQSTNVTFIKVNQNGNVLASNSNGIEDDAVFTFADVLSDVIEKPGGYMAVGTSTVNEETYAFYMDINSNGIATNKDTLVSEFASGDVAIQTMGLAISAAQSNDFIIAGQYPNFRTDTETRGAEAMFMRINQVGEKVLGFESNYGLESGNDKAVDVITLPDGKMILAATIDFGGGVKMISLIKLNDTGALDR